MRKALILFGLIICGEVQAQNNTSDFGYKISDDELVNANFQDQLIVDSADYLKINFADKRVLLQIRTFLKYRSRFDS